jgi:DNA-binding winged helix-turn-helix (wHTH) protein
MASYRFVAGWDFDAASGELRRGGAITRLEPQPAAVLALLASRAGALVTHEQIRQTIWGEATHVNFQDSVHYCVRQIREALGDRAHDRRFIETIPRRGYRFRSDAILGADASSAAMLRSMPWKKRVALACLATVLGAATVLIERRPNNHHQIAVAVLKSAHDLVF